jgi:hypothetical protein
MQRLHFFSSVFILASLLTGCASQASAQPEKVKALENTTSTSLPEKRIPMESATSEVVPHDPSASCLTTVPQEPPFTAPEPYSPNAPFENEFWLGSEDLWTMLPKDGIWYGLPHNPDGYTQKVFWWRDGYVWTEEPEPELIVTGERLDASVPPLIASKATNAYASDIGSAMLVGVDFPTLGCWKITGRYKDAELSFVVWVAP